MAMQILRAQTGEPNLAPDNTVIYPGGVHEIVEALLELRTQAQKLDMKFLTYLLDMAYMEAFERMTTLESRPTPEPKRLLQELSSQLNAPVQSRETP